MGKNSKKSQPEVGITEQLVLLGIMEDQAKEAKARTELKLRVKNAKKKRRQLVKVLTKKVAEVCDHLVTENSTEGSELIDIFNFAGSVEVEAAPNLNFTVQRFSFGLRAAAWVSPGTLAVVPELYALAVANISDVGNVWDEVQPSQIVPSVALLAISGGRLGDDVVGKVIDWLDTLLPSDETTD